MDIVLYTDIDYPPTVDILQGAVFRESNSDLILTLKLTKTLKTLICDAGHTR